MIRLYFHRRFFTWLSFLLRLRATFIFIKVQNFGWVFVLLVLFLSLGFSFMFHFVAAAVGTVLFWTLYSERGLPYLINVQLSSGWYSAIMLSRLGFVNVTWSFLDRKRTIFASLTATGHWLIITSFYTFLSHHGYVQLVRLLRCSLFILRWYLLFPTGTAHLLNT